MTKTCLLHDWYHEHKRTLCDENEKKRNAETNQD